MFALDSVLVDNDVHALVRKSFELRTELVNGVQRVAAGNSGVDKYLKGLCVASTFWVWFVISVFILVDSDDGIGSCVFPSFRRWAAQGWSVWVVLDVLSEIFNEAVNSLWI